MRWEDVRGSVTHAAFCDKLRVYRRRQIHQAASELLVLYLRHGTPIEMGVWVEGVEWVCESVVIILQSLSPDLGLLLVHLRTSSLSTEKIQIRFWR